MGNVIENIGGGVIHAVEKVGGVVKDTVTIGEKVIKLLEDGKALTPELKTALAALVNDAKAVAVAAAPAIVSGGNVAADLAALPAVIAAVVKLVSDITAAEPLIEQVVKVVKADINYA